MLNKINWTTMEQNISKLSFRFPESLFMSFLADFLVVNDFAIVYHSYVGRCGDHALSAIDCGSSGLGSSSSCGHCVVFLDKTLCSRSTGEFTAGCDGLASHPGGIEILLFASSL